VHVSFSRPEGRTRLGRQRSLFIGVKSHGHCETHGNRFPFSDFASDTKHLSPEGAWRRGCSSDAIYLNLSATFAFRSDWGMSMAEAAPRHEADSTEHVLTVLVVEDEFSFGLCCQTTFKNADSGS
jgi:hypothetical protein